jgi:putative DNA primase/helicase
MFQAWVARRGGTGAAEDRNIIVALKLFLELHGNSRFEPWSAIESETPRVIHNRAGFWRADYDNDDNLYQRKFYILPTVFKEEIFLGMDADHAAKVLLRKGALRRGPDGRLTRKERLPGDSTTTRVYVVGAEIFDDVG